MIATIGYLGPQGTNAEAALVSQADLEAVERVPFSSTRAVISAVTDGVVDAGFVPLENSVEGTVNLTVDVLAFDTDLFIMREVDRAVDLALIGEPGTHLNQITEVLSHPHALAQCRETIGRIAPRAELVASTSTAEAVSDVAADSVARAAVGTKHAARVHGLDVLVADVTDHEAGVTRFVLLGRSIPPPTGQDKTSIIAFLAKDKPGSLLSILQELAVRGLNMTKLESRPMKGELGDYFFYIDLEGHIGDALVADALRGLKYRHGGIKFVGSYARVRSDGLFDEPEQEAVWAEAGRWVDEIVGSISETHKTPQ